MRIYTVRVFFCSIILVNENKWLPLLNKNACIRKNIQCHMEIKRDLYLNKLIRSMHNGMIKVVPESAVAVSRICFSICLATI